MNALLSDTPDLVYSSLPPVIVAATSDNAAERASATIHALGLRMGASLSLEEARERIGLQARAGVLWVEVDRDGGASLDALLGDVSRGSSTGHFTAIVSARVELIDPIIACIDDSSVDLIIDASEAERVAALAVAAAGRDAPLRVNDASSERNAERLRQLSEEVSRIASTLARLSTAPGATPISMVHSVEGTPPLSAELVRNVIRARRMRDRFLPGELFADPAWDMMLDLLHSEIAQLRVPVSSLCISAAVPATTALRWVKKLVVEGLFIRRADPHDGRRVFVELAPNTSQALRNYFGQVGAGMVI